jgi:nucleotide-binding universal stress UspA family protein
MSAQSDLFVCAYDFSEQSASALEWAAAFARREGARIDLLHVVPDPILDHQQLAADAITFEAARLEEAGKRLADLAATVSAAGVTVQPHVLTGPPELRIVEHAALHGARAIVVGATGRPMLERWVLGSVAERTIRTSTCPVIVVPRHSPGRPWLPAREGASPPILRALVGLEDADDGGPELIRFAAGLRRQASCDVTFLHLYWPIEEYARLGLRGARNPLEVDPDVVKNVEPKLRALVGGLPGQGDVKLHIQPAFGAPSANIELAADDQPYDLLVVGSHQRHGFSRVLAGSVAERLARHATRAPVACVPVARREPTGPLVAQGLPKILTVLAPTDLSEIGNAAIPHAYALLRATGGVVELCFVAEHALPYPAYVYEQPDRLTATERIRIEQRLRALVPADAAALGITTHVLVVDGGKPAEAIVAAAERLNVDAISLASHGRGGVARAVIGSVADAVVRSARRPVLVIPARRGD